MIDHPSPPFHWPGGIPPEIKADPNGNITLEQANEEAKGWLLYVEENWVPRSKANNIPDEDGDYEVRQRRTLVETWAKASQVFRDSYHQRAPARGALEYLEIVLRDSLHYYNTPRFVCLAPLGPSNPSNRSKWIKLYILSCRLDGEIGHCMQEFGEDHGGLDPNPATVADMSNVQMSDLLPRAYLEMADFHNMTMTRQGTVLYMRYPYLRNWFVVTQDDLDTGHITTVEFKPNGEVDQCFRRRAYNMWPVYLEHISARRELAYVIKDRVGGSQLQNSDLVMTLPVINIMEGAKERREFLQHSDGARDVWAEDIEMYAPGYLEMEAAGTEADYDHSRLLDPYD
ncbi:hypothetical protein N7504_011950 [Penicillium tannophilum]|nr:hypothetical protein N7504_011950 [Penicillium tannophilum]